MRILLLMDPFIPVPPEHYGGIERVIYDVACKYVEMGHSVTIVAGPNSKSPGKLITYGKNGILDASLNLKLSAEVYFILRKEVKQHDVLHNFGRLIFLLPFLKNKIRKVQTYMRYVSKKNIELFDKITPANLTYTSVSNAITNTGKTPKSDWRTIYNCAPIEQFQFRADTSPHGYLAFLGRIERCKGLHSAIKVARLTDRKLIIAGNISDLKEEKEYFEQEIKPLIDGDQITYIGTVNNVQKNELLGNASALLTPVEWFEPFPIIIPEAYACGTPVLGFDNGGIAEGIDQGITGYVSTTVEEMAEHVKNIDKLDRKACRLKAENAYSDKKIAEDYLSVYSN
ncbi:glycosyltransferase [Mucilaginibacter sp. X5P1]|uniref:glycosyltransferase n=1 Tax=Mucilaginibacter sp. X5P1 TaxID=2723088 RepID=UPI001612E785|nr:glycosyltransferase [Mucilaginibacter sp. X5P1]